MGYRIFVPATTANLGPGYDVLGLALDLHLEMETEPAEAWEVITLGAGSDALPKGEDNLIVIACQSLLKEMEAEVEPQRLVVKNPIPVSRGLGSSATAIVAGMALAQLLANGKLHLGNLFQAAARFEAHPDNVAPAVYGGLRICGHEQERFFSEAGPMASNIRVLLVIPQTPTSTEEMRGVLPEHYSQADLDATVHLRSRLLQALANGDSSELMVSQDDVMHQPYRLKVQPESKRIFDFLCTSKSVAGAFLSGSGPTIGAWLVSDESPVEALESQFKGMDIEAQLLVLNVDSRGVHYEVTA